MLTIIETARDGTACLALAGDLDLSTRGDLLAAVEKVRNATAIHVDCAGLDFCDATGVSALIEARDKARAAGVDLTLVNVRGLPRRVLAICEVLAVLTASADGQGDGGVSELDGHVKRALPRRREHRTHPVEAAEG